MRFLRKRNSSTLSIYLLSIMADIYVRTPPDTSVRTPLFLLKFRILTDKNYFKLSVQELEYSLNYLIEMLITKFYALTP